MKFLITIAALLFATCCFAQQQNVYFFKLNGDPTDNKDSSEFVRLVRPPEKGSKFYQVLEYYSNGNQKLAAQSLTVEPIRLEGQCITFFKSGQRRSIENYANGRPVKSHYQYYPNGKLYLYKEYLDDIRSNGYSGNYLIKEVYDSLSTVKVKDGAGTYIGYDDKFDLILEEGAIKNGKRNGEWKGFDRKLETSFTEIYNDGHLLSGTSSHAGVISTYKKTRYTAPEFPGGPTAFGKFLYKQIRYPATDRERGVQGDVYIKFTVEKDGTITNIHVIKSVSPNIDAEALKVLKTTPVWTPGTSFGLPSRSEYMIPITFALAGR
ncbi:MAG: energy transducer TonB [Mucilaginibacter sp.]|nr:energy transducer TonB [Mucilaginibacter sp.]